MARKNKGTVNLKALPQATGRKHQGAGADPERAARAALLRRSSATSPQGGRPGRTAQKRAWRREVGA